MTTIDEKDPVVVIIGSGAGGGEGKDHLWMPFM